MNKLIFSILIFLSLCLIPFEFIHSQEVTGLPNKYSPDLENDFLDAALNGDYYEVRNCLKNGVNVNVETWDGVTSLMYAVSGGYKNIVDILISKGAKVDKIPGNGISALISASQLGFTEIAEMLIKDSANVNIPDYHHATALHYASLYNNDTIVFMLINAGAKVNSLTNDSTSPLALAAINGSYESAFQLIEAGSEVNVRDKYGFSPLMLACQNGYTPLVRLLINNGANVNLCNKKGYSALSLAAINGHADIASMLLREGAVPSQSGSLSLNIRDLAKLSGNKATLDTLKKAGAKTSLLPAFNSFGLGLEANISSNDILTGIYCTQKDLKFGLVYNLGFAMRPFVLTMRESIPQYGYMQLQEHRYIISLDLTKNLNLIRRPETTFGISIGGRGSYSFGKYRGTDIQIHGGLNAAPVAWLYYMNNHWETRLGYQYTRYNEANLKYSHFTIGLVYHFSNPVKPNINRNIKWISQ